jgi:hypothetical protein
MSGMASVGEEWRGTMNTRCEHGETDGVYCKQCAEQGETGETHSGWWIQNGPHVEEIRKAETFNEKWELINRYTALAWQAALAAQSAPAGWEEREELVARASHILQGFVSSLNPRKSMITVDHDSLVDLCKVATEFVKRTAPKPAQDVLKEGE